MNIVNFLKQFNFEYWLLDNLLWEFIFIPIVLVLWYLINSLRISTYLLKNNRLGLGTGVKFYLADRFIEIWYQKDKIYSEINKSYSPLNDFMYAYIHIDAIDNRLLAKKLIFLEREIDSSKDLIKPLKNIRNRLIIFFIKFYLIYFWWDDKKYYKNLKKKK